MDDAAAMVKLCRERLTPCLFRVPSTSLSKELSVTATPRDGSYSSHMLRVTAELTPTMEDAVQLACHNLGFPREILDVYVRPKNENNAFSSLDGGRAKLIFNSYLVEISDRDELAYVVGHELGHYLFPEANVRQLTPNLEGCMISRYSEFTMDRIGLIACRSVDKMVSAELKSLSGLSSKHLRMDATAIIAQWREASKAADTTAMWLRSTHPPTGMRAKALIQFYGSDAYRAAIGQSGGESIDQVNASLGTELDRLLDSHAHQLIAEKLNKLSGWLCAFVASRGIKLRLSNLRHGLCSAPDEIIKRCLSIVIEETAAHEREKVSNEKLVLALQEACELAPGHTRVYLQSVAATSDEIKPLLQQLDGLSRQQGIMIVPPAA
jgi:hypothetical protein